MTEATQAGETESATRTAWLRKLNRFQRLYWDWLAARAAFYDPDVPEDDKVTNTLSDKHDAAEMAPLAEPSPLTWGVWVKWEILDRLITTDATDGHFHENRIITALGAIKADIIRFGLGTDG